MYRRRPEKSIVAGNPPAGNRNRDQIVRRMFTDSKTIQFHARASHRLLKFDAGFRSLDDDPYVQGKDRKKNEKKKEDRGMI